MRDDRGARAGNRPGWVVFAVAVLLFTVCGVCLLPVATLLWPQLQETFGTAPVPPSLVIECLVTAGMAGTLGFAVGRGWVPGESAARWRRSRRIVLISIGITCAMWSTGPGLSIVQLAMSGTWDPDLFFALVMPAATFLATLWCWPKAPIGTRTASLHALADA